MSHAPPAIERAPSTRDRILDTAEALFARQGFAGVGLREVAQRLGLGKSSLFHHFPSKASLYAAVLERFLRGLDLRVDRACVQAGGAQEALSLWSAALIDALAENPVHAPLLLRALLEVDLVGEPERERLESLLRAPFDRAAALMQRGIAEGCFRNVPVVQLVQTLIGITVYPLACSEPATGDAPPASDGDLDRRKHEACALLRSLAPLAS
jgi:AcrR family transcriptional regulator